MRRAQLSARVTVAPGPAGPTAWFTCGMATRGKAAQGRAPGGAGPFSSVPFRWLLIARTIATLGNAAAPIALAFAVLDLTGSAVDLGIVVARDRKSTL